jgi:hypothetical protein
MENFRRARLLVVLRYGCPLHDQRHELGERLERLGLEDRSRRGRAQRAGRRTNSPSAHHAIGKPRHESGIAGRTPADQQTVGKLDLDRSEGRCAGGASPRAWDSGAGEVRQTNGEEHDGAGRFAAPPPNGYFTTTVNVSVFVAPSVTRPRSSGLCAFVACRRYVPAFRNTITRLSPANVRRPPSASFGPPFCT